MMIQQKINSNFIKLYQLLKLSGIALSGSEAKHIILNRQVKLNKKICTLKGKKIFNGDIINYKDLSIEVLSDVK